MKISQAKARAAQNAALGFSVVELVVVITILAILAAVALPKYASFEATSRAAAVNSLSAIVSSAASSGRNAAVEQGVAGCPGSVTMLGQSLSFCYYYPGASAIDTMVNANSGDAANFTFTPGASNAVASTWQFTSAATPAGCAVSYTPPQAAGAAPSIASTTSGC